MDYKRFVLSYYKNAISGVHIQRITASEEAQKPHSHNYFQIYYVLRGSLLHSTEYGEAELFPGDTFLLAPGEVHHISRTTDMELYTFSFMQDIFGDVGEMNRFAVNFLRSHKGDLDPSARANVSAEDSARIRDLLDKIYEEFSMQRLGFGEVVRAYALALISVFARNLCDRIGAQRISDESSERLSHCVEYIDSNFSDQIDLDEIARACAMSKSFFCKSFLSHTGMTFHKYLNTCRIRAAIRYIEKGYKITGIWGLCGYNDFSTFYRNFKRITGCSPKQYFEEGRPGPK